MIAPITHPYPPAGYGPCGAISFSDKAMAAGYASVYEDLVQDIA
jgi:hypothetical protein